LNFRSGQGQQGIGLLAIIAVWACAGQRDGRERRIQNSVSFCRLTSELGLAAAASFQSDPVPVKTIKSYATPTQATILFPNAMK